LAIGVSLLVSLTTTPMMCARLLRSHDQEKHGRLYRASERMFQWILDKYESSLAWVLKHQPLILLVTLLTMGATGFLYVKIPKGFFPQQDTGRINGSIQGDQDISFQEMRNRITQLAETVVEDPAVDSVMAFNGGGFGGRPLNTGSMFLTLKPLAERKINADQVIARLRQKLVRIPAVTLYLQPVQDLRVGGRSSNAQYQYTLQSDNVQDLLLWGPRMLQKLKTVRGLLDVNSDQQNKGLEAGLVIDRATAARLGISTQMIDNTLYDAFGQRQVSTMYTQLNQYHVVLEVDPQFWQSPDSLNHIYVKTPTGNQVPLSTFTHYEPSTAPLVVTHQGQFPSVTLSFNLQPGLALGDAVAAVEEAGREIGLPANIHGSFQGTAQAFQSSLASEPLLIAAALLTVYIVLGVLYESTIHPITILSTLPSAGVGALLALLICHTELSVIALIGIILLIGIVKKNAIMMIDFALEAERTDGKSPVDAIYQACLLRSGRL
jgi:multidrug efflux pump